MADPTTLDGRPTAGGPAQPVTVMNQGGAGGSDPATASNQSTGNTSLATIATNTTQVANDAPDSGNPTKIGFKANDSVPAAVANGDRVDARGSTTGELFVFVANQMELTAAQLTALTPVALGQALAAASTPVVLPATQITTLTPPTAVQDNGPAWTSVWGVAGVPFASANATSIVSVTDAPTSGQKLVITDLIVSVDTAMSVTFKEETSGTVIFGPWYLPANSGPVQLTPRSKKKLPVANKKLQVITSVAGNVTVQAGYYSEA